MSESPRAPYLYPVLTVWQQKPPLGTPLDWGHPLTRGLECCWLFNEGSGPKVYDATGNRHTATFGGQSGHPTHGVWTSAEPPMLPGNAMEFHGTSGVNTGNIETPISVPGSEFTAEFWLKHLALGSADLTIIRNPTGGTLSHLVVRKDGASVGGFLKYFDASGLSLDSPVVFPNDLWVHIAVTRKAHPTLPGKGLVQFWIDGAHTDHETDFLSPFLWTRFTNSVTASALIGSLALGRIWTRALQEEEILALRAAPFAMFRRRPTLLRAVREPHPPVQMRWQAQSLKRVAILRPDPAQIQWRAQGLRATGTFRDPMPAKIKWQVGRFHRALTITPARMHWTTTRQHLPVGLNVRDCGDIYEAALQKTSIGGDWLISAPDIGLFVSFNYAPGPEWEHRIVDISDIEISAPPGGGIAAVANVTVSIAETGRGQSIVQLWEHASAVGAVTVTIDFLLAGADQVLRIFTGAIDSIVVKDAVAQLLLVDDSIQHNLVIPKAIITSEEYPSADDAALTKVQPLVYGQGSKIGAAPMLFVDVTNNTYLVAAHPMRLGGHLAVYDQPTKTFLTLPSIVLIPNTGTATITLGTLTAGALQLRNPGPGVYQPLAAVDGLSTTFTVVPTNLPAPGYPSGVVQPGDGWGFCEWSMSAPGMPRTGTLKLDITNHGRYPGSDPTVTGTFIVRTLDAQYPPGQPELRVLYVSPAFNHVTSLHNTTFILSNINIGVNELLDIVLVTRNQGQVNGDNQYYLVGEVSLTPLVAFSANVSGRPTAVGLPINIQELRFNPYTPTLNIYHALNVTNAALALDGNSTTLAVIGTGTVDSNLDGYGELILTTAVTAGQRANNTVAIDLRNHRRSLASTPTVTGTFAIQTYNTATGVLLRDNLFVTPAFRHQLNPLSTSFVATAINLGATAQLAVRLLARNEGGAGGAGQTYEVGEIGVETFYQPRGDSGDIYLFGDGYEGRTDLTGTVTDYLGSTPGRLYPTPDMVIASMYEDELALRVDLESFATAYNFYAGQALRFDGGIGAGWALEQTNARDLLDQLAKQSTAILFPTFEATWGIRPFRTDATVHQVFDGSAILTEAGSEQQRPEDWTSTVQLTLGNLQNVYNHFEVRFKYNAGSRKYDGVWKVTKDGSNLPAGTFDKAAIEQTCLESWLRYGDLEPLIVEAYWIADDTTAAYYLRHLALYFAQQRLGVQFETTFKAACLQVGDFITITDQSLPVGDNGGVFEVHTIRYMPLKGRIQLVTSRVSSIPDVPVPAPPAALTGCARFADSPGMLACWDFEEVNGARIDHLYEHSLTPVNNPLSGAGKIGTAVQIRRAQSQYLIGPEALAGMFTGAFTLAVWVRLRSVPTDWGAFVCTQAVGGWPYREIFAGVGTGGFLHVGVGYGNTGGNLGAALQYLPFTNTEADWTLVRIWRTCDSTFSGVLAGQLNNNPPETVAFTNAIPQAQTAFVVGAGYEGGAITYLGDFDLDQLMIWRRVLTQTELDAIWNGGLG